MAAVRGEKDRSNEIAVMSSCALGVLVFWAIPPRCIPHSIPDGLTQHPVVNDRLPTFSRALTESDGYYVARIPFYPRFCKARGFLDSTPEGHVGGTTCGVGSNEHATPTLPRSASFLTRKTLPVAITLQRGFSLGPEVIAISTSTA